MVNRFGYNEPTFEILKIEMTDSEIRSVSGGRCNGCGKNLRIEDFRKIILLTKRGRFSSNYLYD